MERLRIDTDIWEIPFDLKEFSRLMGFKQALPTPFDGIFMKVSTTLETGTARAEAIFFDAPEVDIECDKVVVKGVELHTGYKVAGWLRDCDEVVLFICTLGVEFEYRMKSFQADPIEGYFADTIGSLKCEAFADMIHDRIGDVVKRTGLAVTNRYSPGYCHWDVEGQQALFSFFRDSQTGITLNNSSLMSPLKSISGIVGTGKGAKRIPYACSACADSEWCVWKTRP